MEAGPCSVSEARGTSKSTESTQNVQRLGRLVYLVSPSWPGQDPRQHIPKHRFQSLTWQSSERLSKTLRHLQASSSLLQLPPATPRVQEAGPEAAPASFRSSFGQSELSSVEANRSTWKSIANACSGTQGSSRLQPDMMSLANLQFQTAWPGTSQANGLICDAHNRSVKPMSRHHLATPHCCPWHLRADDRRESR